MDFSYEYSDDQKAFRAQVNAWLDRTVPSDIQALIDSPEGASQLRDLTLRLGREGWLASSEPTSLGGGGLDPDLTVVVLEELNKRGLLWLVDGEAQALRTAIGRWGASDQESDRISSLAGGEITVWRHRINLSHGEGDNPVLDTDSVGITATPDGDGYLLNGTGLFSGPMLQPDILWTVALTRSDAGDMLAVCLLVDAVPEHIVYPSTRALAPHAPHRVQFDDVWVLRTDTLGPEGEGHRVVNTSVSLDPRADLPTWFETETEALIDYAKANGLGTDPVQAKVLVEAYIASRVARLLRIRAASLAENREDNAIAESTASLSRRSAASSLVQSTQQVVGPSSLLSAADPRAPARGRFSRTAQRELAEREVGPDGDSDRARIASELGLERN